MAFQLLVRDARTLTVDGLCAEDDAGTLIAAVERKAGVPCANMWLSFAGKRLDPGTSLGAYGLRAGATVHLAVRGRGGGCGASKSERVQPEAPASSGSGTPQVGGPITSSPTAPPSRPELFRLIDTNANHTIELDEFVTSLLLMGGLTHAQLLKAFAAIDTDENGRISEEEFGRMQALFPEGWARAEAVRASLAACAGCGHDRTCAAAL